MGERSMARIPKQLISKQSQQIGADVDLKFLSDDSVRIVNDKASEACLLTTEAEPRLERPVVIGKLNRQVAIETENPLGKGAFGAVYIGQDIISSEFYAVKKQNIRRGEEYKNEAVSELEVLKATNQLVDYYCDGKGNLYTVMTYHHGEDIEHVLFNENDKRKEVSKLERLDIAIAALQSLDDFQNESNMLHRDLKIQNIIWDKETGKCALADFAKAKKMDKDGLLTEESPEGTSMYVAPELFQEPCVYSKKSDVYAMGCVLLELILEQNHSIDPMQAMIYSIKNPEAKGVNPVILKGAPELFSPSADENPMRKAIKKLVKAMLDSDPNNRPTLKHAIEELSLIQKTLHEIVASPQENSSNNRFKAIRFSPDLLQTSCQREILQQSRIVAGCQRLPISARNNI